MRQTSALVLLVAALAAPSLARGQPPGAAGAARPGVGGPPEWEARRNLRREGREKLKKEVLDQMRAMRMWKLTEELKLDQTTAAKVFPVLAEFDDRARALGRERGDIGRELQGQAQAERSPDNDKLRLLVDRLLANQAKRTTLDDERFKALRPALTPLQQAKLLLLLPRIDEDFRHRIREAMDARKRAEESADVLAPGSR